MNEAINANQSLAGVGAGGPGAVAGGPGGAGAGGSGGGATNDDPDSRDRRFFWLTVFQYGLIGIVTLIFVGVLYVGLRDVGSLGNPEVARGLITFLIAVATVAIAMLLTLTAIVTREPDKRFALGKEVLTILVGVLGTIIGFYFGTTTEPRRTQEPQISFAVPVTVSPNPLPNGSTAASVNFQLVGGTPPYLYSINFTPNSVPPIKAKSDTGVISHGFTAAVPDGTSDLVINIEGTDSKGTAFSYNKDGKIKVPLQ